MSFSILSKAELVKALRAKGIESSAFDLHAIDAVSTCQYHTILSDVRSDIYSFEHFICAYEQYEKEECEYHIHDVRSRASYLCATEQSATATHMAGGWQDGLMC